MPRKSVDLIKAPKKRYGLPCYDKSICQRESFCKESDRIVHHTLYRNPCDLDCKMRVNLEDVRVIICLKAKCEFLQDSYCQKYVQESLVKRPRKAGTFPKGISTATGEVRGWYGKKGLTGKALFD